MLRVFIPPGWRDLTGGATEVMAEGATVRALIAALETRHPGLAGRLLDGERLSTGVAVVVDGAVVPRGLHTPLPEVGEVHFLPAIAGGAP